MVKPNINTVSQPRRIYPIRDELEKIATESCKKLGGLALINDRFALVDTKIYEVVLK